MNEFKDTYNSAGISIDSNSGEVKSQSHHFTVRLSPVNLRVLMVLIDHAEQTVSRQQLFDLVWPNQSVSDDALTRSISDLRSQLKPLTEVSPLIDTIPKVGYRWPKPVSKAETLVAPEGHKKIQSKVIDKMKLAIGSMMLLLVFSWGILALIQWFERPISVPLVILPTQVVDDTKNSKINHTEVANSLKAATSDHQKLKYLSQFAIQSHQGSPFPYFSRQYGVRWFIESQFSSQPEGMTVTINLVDAKTALVIHYDQQTIGSIQELNTMCIEFIAFIAQFQ